MVYCGKPSKGCSNCRERKIRCDQKKLGCTQCSRSNKECPGYRNQLDLMFRDESKSVTRKAKAKAKKASTEAIETSTREGEGTVPPILVTEVGADVTFQLQLSDTGRSSSAICSPGDSSTSQDYLQDEIKEDEEACENCLTQLELMRVRGTGGFASSLIPTAEDLATGFFQTNFLPSNGSRGQFDFIPMLYSESSTETHLTSSMTAVGLAGFANTARAPGLMGHARANYVRALRLINEAIQSPTAATKDSLLLSIILLSVFETVTGNTQKSLKAWTKHINGAAALIKLRGHSQFRTTTGVRLFLLMTSNLMVSCVQRGIAMPPHILVLRREAAKYIDTSDPSWKLSESILKFIAYRSDVRNGMFPTDESILNGALAVDASFIQASSNLPDSWQYKIVHTTADIDEVWNGHYHVYNDYWIAQVLNAMRTCRILINEYVRDTLLRAFLEKPPRWMDREHSDMFQRAAEIEYQMRDEILASVPQHTGYVDKHQHSNSEKDEVHGASNSTQSFASDIHDNGGNPVPLNPGSQKRSASFSFPRPTMVRNSHIEIVAGKKDFLRAAGGYFLLWPLYLVGEMLLGTEEIRKWVIVRLRYVGDTMGIMQAHTLATSLEKREEIHAWDVDDKHIRFETLEEILRDDDAGQSEKMDSEDAAPVDYTDKVDIADETWLGQEAWDYSAATNGIWKDGDPLSVPLHPLHPVNEVTFSQETGSLSSPLDEWYPMEQVISSQHSEMETQPLEMGSLEHDGYTFQESDMNCDVPTSNAYSSVTNSPAWLSQWQQKPDSMVERADFIS